MASAPTPLDRPHPDGSDIRKLVPAELEPAAVALAASFEDDPQWSWILRDDATRRQRLETTFRRFLKHIWLPADASWTVGEVPGAALWMPPGAWHVGFGTQLRLTPGLIGVFRGDLLRALRALNTMERRHPKQPEHWYLAVLGLAPEWQGRGYGTALMKPVLDRCDAEGIPAYLEASSPRSRELYERNGFAVQEEMRFAEGAPPLWRMWREPQR